MAKGQLIESGGCIEYRNFGFIYCQFILQNNPSANHCMTKKLCRITKNIRNEDRYSTVHHNKLHLIGHPNSAGMKKVHDALLDKRVAFYMAVNSEAAE